MFLDSHYNFNLLLMTSLSHYLVVEYLNCFMLLPLLEKRYNIYFPDSVPPSLIGFCMLCTSYRGVIVPDLG